MKTLKLILGFFTALNISIATQTADILLSDLPGCAVSLHRLQLANHQLTEIAKLLTIGDTRRLQLLPL